jgi:hypothetical protein
MAPQRAVWIASKGRFTVMGSATPTRSTMRRLVTV